MHQGHGWRQNSSDTSSKSPTKISLFDPGVSPPGHGNSHQLLQILLWDYFDASVDLGIHRKVCGSVTDHHRHQLRDQTSRSVSCFESALVPTPIKYATASISSSKRYRRTSYRLAEWGVSSPWERRTSLRLPCWLTCGVSVPFFDFPSFRLAVTGVRTVRTYILASKKGSFALHDFSGVGHASCWLINHNKANYDEHQREYEREHIRSWRGLLRHELHQQ